MIGKIVSNKNSTCVTYALIAALFITTTSNIVLITYYKRQGSGYTGVSQVQYVPQQYCGSQAASIEKMELVMTETKTDKMHTHHYYRTYGRLFAHMQNDHVRLLEIGVQEGFSMQTWIRYFTNYDHIYGIGYKNYQTELKQDIPEQNITLYMGDQSDVQFLNYVCEDAGTPFDIIIDDGSHVPQHQIISLQSLMKCLKPVLTRLSWNVGKMQRLIEAVVLNNFFHPVDDGSSLVLFMTENDEE